MMRCRKSYIKVARFANGGLGMVRVKCGGTIDDDGRCCACGGTYGNRRGKPLRRLVEAER